MTSIIDKEPTRYGWYSESADIASKRYRLSKCVDIYYNTPSGNRVKVTCVNHSNTESGTAWPDIKCIGEVTTYINNKEGTHCHDK